MMSEPVLSRIWSIWRRPWPLSPAVLSIAVSLLAAYCGALVYLGALHTNLFGHDYFIFLDSGWRVLNGQRPHVDFHTAQGPVFCLYSAFAMIAAGSNLSIGFGIARAVATAAFTVWCFLLLRNRVAPAATLVLCVVIALMAGAPFAPTSSPFTQSMAMFYNRFGYVLLALVILEGFRPAPSSFRSGFSSGIAISLALFLKINFFGAALGFLALSLIVRRPRWGRLAGIAAGFLSLTALFLAWLRFDVAAMVSDLHALAVARSGNLPLHRLLRTVDNSLLAILLLVSVGLIVSALNWGKKQGSLNRLYPVALALATVIAELAVGLANQQDAVFFLMSIGCVLLLASISDVGIEGATQPRSLLGAILILGLCLPIPGALYDLAGFANALQDAVRHRTGQGVPRIDAPELSSLIFEGRYPLPYKYENGPPMVDAVNDGIHLLQAHTATSDRVLTLGFVNPFPVALRRPAPRGAWVWMFVDFNIAEGDYPSAATLFAEVDAVMVPKYDGEAKPTTDALVAQYHTTLQRDYVLNAESSFWTLYTRRARPQ
jgi:hypothetical protein